MEHTSNYELSKWAESDRIQMEDFNMDHDKIDAALAGSTKISSGTYIGTGTYGNSNLNSLSFDFVPKLLFVCGDNYIGILIGGSSLGLSTGIDSGVRKGCLEVVWDGQTVSWYCRTHYVTNTSEPPTAQHQLNSNTILYHYTALG